MLLTKILVASQLLSYYNISAHPLIIQKPLVKRCAEDVGAFKRGKNLADQSLLGRGGSETRDLDGFKNAALAKDDTKAHRDLRKGKGIMIEERKSDSRPTEPDEIRAHFDDSYEMSIEKAKQDQFFNGLYQHLTQLYKGTPSRDEQGILRGGRIVSHEDWAIFRAREALDTKIHEYQDAVHDKTHSNKELDAQLDEISKSLSLIDKKIISQAEKSEKETPHRPVGSFNPGDDLSQEAASINFMKLMHKDCIEEVIKSERSFINNLGYFTGYHLQWIEAAVRAKLAMASEGMGLLDYQSLKRLIRHIHRQECFRALINIINSHRLP